MKVWKMIFHFKQVIFRFHINFPGCTATAVGEYLAILDLPPPMTGILDDYMFSRATVTGWGAGGRSKLHIVDGFLCHPENRMKTGVIFCWPKFNSTLFLPR